jgi:hypothetical protein
MQNQNQSLSDQAVTFLKNQAQVLETEDQLCQLITRGPHTSYYGRIVSVEEGGLVFNEDSTSQQVITPWENVEKFITIPTNTQASARRAGTV